MAEDGRVEVRNACNKILKGEPEQSYKDTVELVRVTDAKKNCTSIRWECQVLESKKPGMKLNHNLKVQVTYINYLQIKPMPKGV